MDKFIFINGKLVAAVLSFFALSFCSNTTGDFVLHLQKRLPSDSTNSAKSISVTTAKWKANETAIIICDMWDKHWCKGATRRVEELAPAINEFITIARNKGALIVHAPSNCMNYYKNDVARKNATKYNAADKKFDSWRYKTGEEVNYQWPIDSVTQGCNDTPYCKTAIVWTKENDLIQIKDQDIISESGSEMAAVFKDKGIKNILICGVHLNMCVMGRSFAIRSLKERNINVALVRDLTDAMYDSRQWPYVSHFAGVGLMVDYIEKYLCPSILSSDITNKPAFRFKEDDRK